MNKKKNISLFNCKQVSHIVAEILYVTANALSSQAIYSQSNFFLNLSKYLNENFNSYDALLAENFYKNGNLKKAQKIYNNLSKYGESFNWYSAKQIANILILKNKKDEALKMLNKSYNRLTKKEIYETFDYAEFLKNNEKFEELSHYIQKL